MKNKFLSFCTLGLIAISSQSSHTMECNKTDSEQQQATTSSEIILRKDAPGWKAYQNKLIHLAPSVVAGWEAEKNQRPSTSSTTNSASTHSQNSSSLPNQLQLWQMRFPLVFNNNN